MPFLYFYLRYLYSSHSKVKSAIPHLVSVTLNRLANQAALHAQDREDSEPWISIGQLRDDVLRDEHSISKREKIWSRVKAVVEMNSNVRSSQREGRNGEVSRVWEWIGAIADIEGESRERRRKSGRVSWYQEGAMGSSPISGMDDGPESAMQESRWSESRPIY